MTFNPQSGMVRTRVQKKGYIPEEVHGILKKIFRVSVVAVLLISFLDIIGLISGIDWLRSAREYWAPMKIITAICLIAISISLWIIYLKRPARLWKPIALFSGMVLGAISILTILSWIYFEINGHEIPLAGHYFFRSFLSPENRFSVLSSIIILITGTNLVLLAKNGPAYSNIAHILCFPGIILSYMIPVGYLMTVLPAHQFLESPVALNSGIAFFFVFVAIFVMKPDTWLLRVFSSGNSGGIMARRMLPWLIFLPVLIGRLRVGGEDIGMFVSHIGVLFVTLTYTFCLILLVWIIARSVNYLDQRRHLAEMALKKSHDELEEKVMERTSDLLKLNEALDAEIKTRVKTEKLVEFERQRINGILEQMPAYIILLTPDYNVAYANRFFRERFGESEGKHCYEFLFHRDTPCEICETFKVLTDNRPRTWEWTGPDGRTYSIYDFPYKDIDGSVLIMETGIDITSEKEAESKLKDLNKRLEQRVKERTSELLMTNERLNILSQTSGRLLETENPQELINSLCIRVMKFLDCQVFFNFLANEARCKLYLNSYHGIPEKTAEAIRWLEFGEAVCGTVAQQGVRIIAENISESLDPGTDLVRSFGVRAYACHPLFSQDKVIGTLSFGTKTRSTFSESDISMMKNVADQVSIAITRFNTIELLKKSEEKYRNLLELSPSACLVIRNHRVVLANSSAVILIGAGDADDLIGSKKMNFFHPDYHKDITDMVKKVALGITVPALEAKIVRLDGEVRDIEIVAGKITDSEGPAIQIIMNDITGRLRAEQSIRESKEKLEIALENARIGTWELDVPTGRLKLDERMEVMFNKEPGKTEYTISEFEENIHEEDLLQVRGAFAIALKEGKPLETIYRLRSHKNGINYISSKALVERDSKGNPVKMSGVSFDITDMKRGTEKALFALNEDLKRSNRELEQFAYVASHDLQEPLRMISSFTQLLAQRYKDKLDQDAHEFIQFAVDGALRMQILINDLLEYSRIETRGKKFSPVGMQTVLDQVIKNINLMIRESKAIITSDGLPEIVADEHQIVQLLQNLLINSLKFCDVSPRVFISATEQPDSFLFSLKDNGIGIESEYHEKIFQIFQRLHSRDDYGGTGIGLAICKRIVERHGGKIWVDSGPGKGSVFYFTILKR
jgi:PAS domain S-box-containing protein